jgi:squalene-hopene/tetraprenyl-beta-curcumene cyclase
MKTILCLALTISLPMTAAAATPAPTTRPAATRPAEANATVSPALRAEANAAIARGLDYLESVQDSDGAWKLMGVPDPAITSIAARAFARDPNYGPDHPVVRKALAFVLSYRQNDGGIYRPGLNLDNYYTSVALMFLSSMERLDPRIARAIRSAQQCLKDMQWTEGRSDPESGDAIEPDNPWYGGAGYGNHKRPDLSNTQMMVEALHQSGLPADDPAYQKAMKFISRCQMLSQTNDQPFVQGAQNGGFIYTCANNGESKAGTVEDGDVSRLRTYGSMTYSGFKSMIYAGLDRDDPRVQAARDWIREHYTLDQNPNMPRPRHLQGLFYYYNVFAKALAAWGHDVIVDKAGRRHNWREDLIAKLVSLQRQDGTWMNQADRWYEGNPHYITGLTVMTLQETLK